MIKFVGECYNFKVIHTTSLFDLLYRLININYSYGLLYEEGVQGGEPQQFCSIDEYMKSLDSPGDSFRIRLICTILDSLGKYFSRVTGSRKKEMDRFLMYL